MATENYPEANYYELQGLMLADNLTNAQSVDHAADAGEHMSPSDDHGTGEHSEVAHDDAHGATGMPQLDTSTYSNQIFWLVLCLIAIYFIFSRIALPRIGGTIEQRAQTIQRDLDRAAEMKHKAEDAEAQYNQTLIDARAKAHEIAEKNKAKIQANLDAATAKADAEIAKQTEASTKRLAKMQKDAEKSAETVASEVAQAILEKLAPSVADEKSVKAAVDQVLKG